MDTLPRDIMLEVIYNLKPTDIAMLAQTHSTLSNLCTNEKIWEKVCEKKRIKVSTDLPRLQTYKEFILVPVYLVGKAEENEFCSVEKTEENKFKVRMFGYLRRNCCDIQTMSNRVFSKSFIIFTDKDFVFRCVALYDELKRCFSSIQNKRNQNDRMLAFWFPQDYCHNKTIVQDVLNTYRLSQIVNPDITQQLKEIKKIMEDITPNLVENKIYSKILDYHDLPIINVYTVLKCGNQIMKNMRLSNEIKRLFNVGVAILLMFEYSKDKYGNLGYYRPESRCTVLGITSENTLVFFKIK